MSTLTDYRTAQVTFTCRNSPVIREVMVAVSSLPLLGKAFSYIIPRDEIDVSISTITEGHVYGSGKTENKRLNKAVEKVARAFEFTNKQANVTHLQVLADQKAIKARNMLWKEQDDPDAPMTPVTVFRRFSGEIKTTVDVYQVVGEKGRELDRAVYDLLFRIGLGEDTGPIIKFLVDGEGWRPELTEEDEDNWVS